MNIIRLNCIGEPFAKSGQATPPSGGSGSTWRYFKTNEGWVDYAMVVYIFAMSACFDNGKYYFVAVTPTLPQSNVNYARTDLTKFAFDSSFLFNVDGMLMTWSEFIKMTGMSSEEEYLNSAHLTEITKEEFYNLEA